MKNIVLCFDHDRADSRATTNVRAVFDLLDGDDPNVQVAWYHSGTGSISASGAMTPAAGRTRQRRYSGTHNSLVDAYLFVADFWEPGDRIYVFGAGCGAYCARALTRLLNTVGVLAPESDELLQYVLENWALPHTHRTPEDWESLARLATRLFGAPDTDIAVGVEYLGLWDTTKVPGLPQESAQHPDADPLANVAAGRHAVAIDERRLPARQHLVSPAAAVEEVWFRGTHADVTGGSGGRHPLAGIALDWVLKGAVRAGLRLADPSGVVAAAPTEVDVLTDDHRLPAGTRFGIGLRSVPDEALVHASVRAFLGRHPLYWNRLPELLSWADPGWPARSERLVAAATGPLVTVPQRLTA